MRSTRLKLPAILTALCLFAAPVFAGGEGWTHDYEAAKTQASEQGKDLLMDFTGSDWCGWCIKLVKEVFSKDEFKAYANDNFILVELDFPRDKSKVSDETKAQNESLKKAFAVRGFPTIYLTDATGKPYAKTGYKQGGPEAYIAHLEELKQVRIERDEHLAAAKDAAGLEKAKHLFAAMQALGDDMALLHYKDTVDQIIALDADNEAGLKKHYEDIETAKEQRKAFQLIMREARSEPEAAIAKLEAVASDEQTLPVVKQEALAMKSQIQMFIVQDRDAAKKTLIEAIEIDPESEMAEQLKGALERFFGDGV